MKQIVLARCALMAPFAATLNDIGAPAERLLAKFGLPMHLEQKPNDYFPLTPALHFATVVQASQGIMDFGFHASQRLRFGHLSEQVQASVCRSPTLLAGLHQWCRLVQLENTFISFWLEHHENDLRICSVIPGTEGMLHLEHSQWVQNVMTINVIRQFAGPNWAPATIAFEARYTPGIETQSRWPNTRFLSGQYASWIDVPIELLSQPNPVKDVLPDPSRDAFQAPSIDTVSMLKLLLRSYVNERVLSIAEVAETIGTSVRTLQRELASVGLTFTDVLGQARFEKAVTLLHSTDAKIIDIAFATGYADPAHFSRSFRRIAGVSPRKFREKLILKTAASGNW